MSKVITAPETVDWNRELHPTVFLAGSIEMDKAERWQDKAISLLSGFNILNPRRPEWDSSWVQSIHNPYFHEQVTWELEGLESSDFVLFYFDSNTMSPITLLELGLMAGLIQDRDLPSLHVVCPDGYWRKGNVDIVCERYGVYTYDSLEEAIANIKKEWAKK